jgi:hypothetical protein
VTRPSIGTEFPPVFLISRLLLGLACGLGFASAAAGQDLTTAPKVACTPESVTRCEAADKCTTRPASARDKGEVLVIDFGAKAASINRNGATKKFADVIRRGRQRRRAQILARRGRPRRRAEARRHARQVGQAHARDRPQRQQGTSRLWAIVSR